MRTISLPDRIAFNVLAMPVLPIACLRHTLIGEGNT